MLPSRSGPNRYGNHIGPFTNWEKVIEANRLREEGHTVAWTANHIGVSPHTLQRWIRVGLISGGRKGNDGQIARKARATAALQKAWEEHGPFRSAHHWARAAGVSKTTCCKRIRAGELPRVQWIDPDALLPHCRSERETDIVLRHGAGDTLKSIGDDYGVTRERVRQILARVKARADREAADVA